MKWPATVSIFRIICMENGIEKLFKQKNKTQTIDGLVHWNNTKRITAQFI